MNKELIGNAEFNHSNISEFNPENRDDLASCQILIANRLSEELSSNHNTLNDKNVDIELLMRNLAVLSDRIKAKEDIIGVSDNKLEKFEYIDLLASAYASIFGAKPVEEGDGLYLLQNEIYKGDNLQISMAEDIAKLLVEGSNLYSSILSDKDVIIEPRLVNYLGSNTRAVIDRAER